MAITYFVFVLIAVLIVYVRSRVRRVVVGGSTIYAAAAAAALRLGGHDPLLIYHPVSPIHYVVAGESGVCPGGPTLQQLRALLGVEGVFYPLDAEELAALSSHTGIPPKRLADAQDLIVAHVRGKSGNSGGFEVFSEPSKAPVAASLAPIGCVADCSDVEIVAWSGGPASQRDDPVFAEFYLTDDFDLREGDILVGDFVLPLPSHAGDAPPAPPEEPPREDRAPGDGQVPAHGKEAPPDGASRPVPSGGVNLLRGSSGDYAFARAPAYVISKTAETLTPLAPPANLAALGGRAVIPPQSYYSLSAPRQHLLRGARNVHPFHLPSVHDPLLAAGVVALGSVAPPGPAGGGRAEI